MQTAPPSTEIARWLREHKPLGLFGEITPEDIRDTDPKPISGHFNFLIRDAREKYVLRFRGPEWGTPQGVTDEYEILRAVAGHAVGPNTYFHTDDFFGEPMMLQEYLRGTPFSKLPRIRQTMLASSVGAFIARVNRLPFPGDVLSMSERVRNFLRHKETWRWRIETTFTRGTTAEWAERIQTLLPKAHDVLDRHEELLDKIYATHPEAFVFESAHAGHLIKTLRDFRFINWEKISHGDPSFTFAVFLTSLAGNKNLKTMRTRAIRAYLRENPIPHFEELLEGRLAERAVSNLVYVLWQHSKRTDDNRSVEDATSVVEKFECAERLLA